MNPAERNYEFYLSDMLLAMQRIEEYIDGYDFVRFKKTYLVVDAVIRNFEVLGEASKHIPQHITDRYPSIPWKKMYRLRNIISHEYFGIDYEMIWKIATLDLPQNCVDLQALLVAEGINGVKNLGDFL